MLHIHLIAAIQDFIVPYCKDAFKRCIARAKLLFERKWLARRRVVRSPVAVHYHSSLINAFETALANKDPVQIEQGQILYRGGECQNKDLFSIRLGNVFLSSYPAYARCYAGYWNKFDYNYVYRAVINRHIKVAKVYNMSSIVDVAVKDLKVAPESNAIHWQRENLILIANQFFGVKLDGVLFIDREDKTTDEFLIDNTINILDLEDYYVYRKGNKIIGRENEVLRLV